MRFKLTLAYEGCSFRGWQVQKDTTATVQQVLEDAIFHFCGQHLRVVAAGRTDAGVHALGQVCHVDFPPETTAYNVRRALNYHLKKVAVKVLIAEHVADNFHARFDATAREYDYRVLNRIPPPVLEMGRVWHVYDPLHMDAMREAAQHLLGYHDFSSFRGSACQAKHPMRTVDVLNIVTENELVLFNVQSKSFLHHQVRNMVGTLILVGRGKWQPERVKTALEAKDRKAGGVRAPAAGLYFTKVHY